MVENFIISIGASFASKVLTVGPMYRKELAQVRPELARMGHTPPGAFSWPQLAAIALESLKFVPAQASNLVLKGTPAASPSPVPYPRTSFKAHSR